MVQILKVARNAHLHRLRKEDRKKWTYEKLGKEFNVSKIRAREIFLEWEARLSTAPQIVS